MPTGHYSQSVARKIIPEPLADIEPAQIDRGSTRIDSIDLLRGIVMVIMMLDHTRDFVHSGS